MAFYPASINTVPFSFGDTGIKCDFTGNCIIAENAKLVDELQGHNLRASRQLQKTSKKVCDSQNNCRTETYYPKSGNTNTTYTDSAGNSWSKSVNKKGDKTIVANDGKEQRVIQVKGKLFARDNFKMNAKISGMGSFGFNTANVLI